MKGSNTLTSHHGESSSSRADKMSGWIKQWKKDWKSAGTSMKFAKKFSSRKRRMFLKNENNWEKN